MTLFFYTFILFLPLTLYFVSKIVESMEQINIVEVYVHKDVKPVKATKSTKVAKPVEVIPSVLTSSSITDDAISALISLKMRKNEAKSRVMELATSKKYTDVGTLVIEALK